MAVWHLHFPSSKIEQEALLKGLSNKIPKAVAASADVLLQAVRRAPLDSRTAVLLLPAVVPTTWAQELGSCSP